MVAPLELMYITSGYGPRQAPIPGASTFHEAIDLRAAVGTPVYAPADGEVISNYTHGLGGLQMIVRHDNGYKTGYAHLSQASEVGKRVRQGEVIALTGNSGGVDPHLHWTVRNPNNEKINPETLLPLPSPVNREPAFFIGPDNYLSVTPSNNFKIWPIIAIGAAIAATVYLIRKRRNN